MAWWDTAPLAPAAPQVNAMPGGAKNWWDNAPMAEAENTAAMANPGTVGVAKEAGNSTALTTPTPQTAGADWGDIGMSALSSPQEAAARTVALPAQLEALSSMVGRGIAKAPLVVANAVGVPGADTALEYVNQAYAKPSPISQAVQDYAGTEAVKGYANQGARMVDRATGGKGEGSIFYTPQTGAGKLTQEGLVGALMGAPAGVGTAGALSGLAGEGTRQMFEGTDLEQPASMVAALAAGGLPAAARKFGTLSRPGDILARSLDGVDEKAFTQAQGLMKDAQDLGVPLTGPEALQQALGGQTSLGLLQRRVETAPGGEPIMRPFSTGRSGQVRQAGEQLLTDTFGIPTANQATISRAAGGTTTKNLAAPETAVKNAQAAAQKTINQAETARTGATQGDFEASKAQTVPIPGLDALRAQVDERIKLAGPDNNIGRKLREFRSRLDQGIKDRAAAEAELTKAGLNPQSQAFKDAMQQAGFTDGEPLGPLVTMNREYAERMRQRYDPTAGADQSGFDKAELGEITPLNNALTKLLEGAMPSYGKGLKEYGKASEPITQMYESGLGRIMQMENGDVGGRLTTMANEFLSPNTDPARIRTLSAQLSAADPTAVQGLVGARLKTVFDEATKNLQTGGNPWGGAKFVTQVMGNPQARENLRATIETLPNGKSLWAGWNKFDQVMQATGKRLPRGSDTAANLAVDESLKQVAGGGGLVQTAKNLGVNFLEERAARVNATQLARIFTHPESVAKMRELAILNPASRRAQLLAAEILAITNNDQQESPDAASLQ